MCGDAQLVRALCGFPKTTGAVDKPLLWARSSSVETSSACYRKAGTPTHRSPCAKGRPIIALKVSSPEKGFLSPDKLRFLEALPPARKEVAETEGQEQGEPWTSVQMEKDGTMPVQTHAREADEQSPWGGTQGQASQWWRTVCTAGLVCAAVSEGGAGGGHHRLRTGCRNYVVFSELDEEHTECAQA